MLARKGTDKLLADNEGWLFWNQASPGGAELLEPVQVNRGNGEIHGGPVQPLLGFEECCSGALGGGAHNQLPGRNPFLSACGKQGIQPSLVPGHARGLLWPLIPSPEAQGVPALHRVAEIGFQGIQAALWESLGSQGSWNAVPCALPGFPPLQKNAPAVAGALGWARELRARIQEPLEHLRRFPEL